MAIVASAPGKVLIAGGYLLLERPNFGLVLSTTSRFYAIVRPLYEEIKAESLSWPWVDVKITSPQLSREATYKLSLKTLLLRMDSPRENSNLFVEYAIRYAVAAAKETFIDNPENESLRAILLKGIHITILGSNDFYSYRNQIVAHGLPLTPETLASLPPFSPITFNIGLTNGRTCENMCKPEVAKTGLGSSAAMTTAVVASLLCYLGVVNLPTSYKKVVKTKQFDDDLNVIHAVAQTAHCIAQGKIGSGFDVSTAVYGSQRYVRFSPDILSEAQEEVHGAVFQDIMADILESEWDHRKRHFSLPPLMTLILGEPGTGGSSTPSMVGAVNKWKQSDPQKSLELWEKLDNANSSIDLHLRMLTDIAEGYREIYDAVLNACSKYKSHKWMELADNTYSEAICRAMLEARNDMLEVRSSMQAMGKAAGVPIEPEPQTHLLDLTMETEGVLFAGVPGAGGYDAVFAITLGESGRAKVIETWTSLGVLPLLVREDPQGLRLETGGDPRQEALSTSGSVTAAGLQ